MGTGAHERLYTWKKLPKIRNDFQAQVNKFAPRKSTEA